MRAVSVPVPSSSPRILCFFFERAPNLAAHGHLCRAAVHRRWARREKGKETPVTECLRRGGRPGDGSASYLMDLSRPPSLLVSLARALQGVSRQTSPVLLRTRADPRDRSTAALPLATLSSSRSATPNLLATPRPRYQASTTSFTAANIAPSTSRNRRSSAGSASRPLPPPRSVPRVFPLTSRECPPADDARLCCASRTALP